LEDLFGTGAAPKRVVLGRFCHHELEFLTALLKIKLFFAAVSFPTVAEH
jgi:hypothetical protein